MESARDALEQWDSSPEESLPADRLGDLLGHGDAQPAALAHRTQHRRDRHGGQRGLPADRTRDPDLPRLLLFRPPPSRDPLPQRADRPARADEGGPGADRRHGHRGPAASRAGRPRRCGRASRRRRRGNLHLPPVRLPQCRARAAGGGDRRRGQGRTGRGRRGARSTWPRSSTRCAATSRGSTRP